MKKKKKKKKKEYNYWFEKDYLFEKICVFDFNSSLVNFI